jgi:YVTN family beta-propeller protein
MIQIQKIRRRSDAGSPALSLALALVLGLAAGCTEKPSEPEIVDEGVPAPSAVQRIFNQNCTTTSCHSSVAPAAELSLVSWDRLIEGSRYGEVIIAYRSDDSHMIDHLTGRATPRMPLSRDPLPPADIETIRQWVGDGAPSAEGDIPFAETKRKIYVTNQGSDKISVIDADAMVVMRLIDVGVLPGADVPHNVYVDRQNRYFYVSLITSGRVSKFDAETDELLGTAVVGQSPANMVTSPDGSTLYVTNWSPTNATFHVLDAATMTERFFLTYPPSWGTLPHGLCITDDGSTLYTTQEGAGMVFRIRPEDDPLLMEPIFLEGENPDATLRPLQVLLDENEERLFVTCNGTGEVRVIDLATDEMVKTIAIDGRPWLLDLTDDGRRIYVGNWGKNAVDVIDPETMSVVTSLTNGSVGRTVFARPHGVAINEEFAFISNENTNGGIPEHHPTGGGGNNGTVAIVRLANQEVVKTLDVEVDPTGVAFVELP